MPRAVPIANVPIANVAPSASCRMGEVVIVRTGCANIASVRAAFARLGCDARETGDASVIETARAVVLPGVGHFGAAMRGLRESGLDSAIRSRVEAGRPLLAICLGMQVLCEASEEALGERGLGVVEGTVRRFPAGVRVPHMGWNHVTPVDRSEQDNARLLHEGAMYFANSYRLSEAPQGWGVALSEHAGPFVAAIERGPVLACQFHPELSGRAGEALLARWLARAGVGAIVRRGIPC